MPGPRPGMTSGARMERGLGPERLNLAPMGRRRRREDPSLPTFRRPTRYGPAVPSSEGRIRMSKSIMEIVAAAKQAVPAISPAEAAAMMGRDDVLVVDVRDLPELAEGGKVKGALQ